MAASPLNAVAGIASLIHGASAYRNARDTAAATVADRRATLAQLAQQTRNLERKRDQALASQRVRAGQGNVLIDSDSSADVQATLAGQTAGDIFLLNQEADARLEHQRLAARSATRRANATLLTTASRFGSGIAGLEL